MENRLKNEIKIQKEMEHPCILNLHHYFEDEDSVYLVLELCKGGELYTYIKSSKKLSEETTKCFTKQLIKGLLYLHSKGVIHRDLKLSNILLSFDQRHLKIAEFGLAT